MLYLTLSKHFIVVYFRCLTAAANPRPSEKLERAVLGNQSFVQNFFLGKVEAAEIFPYPYNLSDEEKETLGMVVDPLKRFFSVSELKMC